MAAKKAEKRDEVIAKLRHHIKQGRFAAGGRLPVRTKLARELGISSVTLQRALDRLREEGFVHSVGREGTYVVERPPHLHNYALVFHYDPADPEGPWSRYYTALSNVALTIQRREQRIIEPFYGINGSTDGQDYQRLLRRLQSQQLAGLIFANTPHRLLGTPLMADDGLPRVALMSEPMPGLPVVAFDRVSFFEKALDYFAARGRRRVAVLCLTSFRGEVERNLVPRVAARQMTMKPIWQLPLSIPADGAKNCVQLLMSGRPEERPDALIIADDNLVEPAVAGLIAAGMRVPEDLEVVAFCNFPWVGPRVLPLQWLGYDADEVLHACLDSIDRQRGGQSVPKTAAIAAQFEEELTAKERRPGLVLSHQ